MDNMLLELDFKRKNLTLLCIFLTGILCSILVCQNPILLAITVCLAFYLLTGDRPTSVYKVIITLPRDIKTIVRFIKFLLLLKSFEKQKMTIPKLFRQTMYKNPLKDAFIMGDDKLTFQDVENLSNKIAAYFKKQGFNRGDTVALLMDTCPDYPCIWLGLSKIGVVTALVNFNLKKESLLHSIKIVNSKAIITCSEFIEAVNEIKSNEGIENIKLFQYTNRGETKQISNGYIDLSKQLEELNSVESVKNDIHCDYSDKVLYIYTSGTTGLPKASIITQARLIFMVSACKRMLAVRENDIIYDALPLYHSAGGILGVASALIFGNSIVLRKKFSASNFWNDCVKYNCTIAQYIGEICRFLLSTPKVAAEKQHRIRLMFGNGLRPQIWENFVSRFNIPEIGEFYGATEGNSNLINCSSQAGAVGFVPVLVKNFYPVKLIKFNEETGEPIRNANNNCIECSPGEPGILIGKIDAKRIYSAFQGYAEKEATKKKILCNVFTEGDMYFNSGDVLVMDILNYFYFKDRTGDTFRWRGENVATSEVEAIISNSLDLKDCIVYGVEVPHCEGKAGMAAIVDRENKINMNDLSIAIRGSLPIYARPLFIRIIAKPPMTGTFKLKKGELQKDGYDIDKIKDPIYFLNSDGIYRLLNQDMYQNIKDGNAKL